MILSGYSAPLFFYRFVDVELSSSVGGTSLVYIISPVSPINPSVICISMVVNEESDVGSLPVKRENQKSDVFGVWVKLKMPKEEDGGDFGNNKNETMKKDSSNMSVKRVCHICEKAFSSGKALGGHMRSHVQLSHPSKIKLHQTVTFKNPNPSQKSTNCVICGKNFPTLKSLFGHMRCHPERDWRGIHPPPSSSSPSSSLSSSLSDAGNPPNKTDDHVEFEEKEGAVDLTESLSRWPVTAKRGRKATATAATVSADDDEDGLREAVNFLMMLAEGRRKDSGGVGDDDKMNVLMKKKRKKVKLCDLNLHDQKCDESSSSNNNIPTCGKLLDFDLNEVPESEPQLLVGNSI